MNQRPSKLRPYQIRAHESIWRKLSLKQAQLIQMPMGTGKTELFIELCEKAIEHKSDIKILIVLNKVMLVEQTERRMKAHLTTVDIGVFCSTLKSKELAQITVASVQSVCDQDLDGINLVILDEAHRVTYTDGSPYQRLLTQLKVKNDKLKIIGFTATPWKATGNIYGEGELFDQIDFLYPIEDAISEGWLVKPRLKATTQSFDMTGVSLKLGDYDQGELAKLTADEGKALAQIAEAMLRLDGRKSVAWACTTIEHCEMVKRLIPEPCAIVHSKMKKVDQDGNKRQFENGDIRHIAFVTMLSEGIDVPRIDAIVLLRPTRSPVLALQTIGRALRLFQGKLDALILDFGKVIESIGPINNPRIPKKGDRKGGGDAILMKFCKACFEYVSTSTKICPACDAPFVVERDVFKSLTTKPDSNSEILVDKKRTYLKVTSVSLSRFMSHAGNLCLRVTFATTNPMYTKISQYFQWSNEWARIKAARLLGDIGVEWSQEIDALLNRPIRRVPSEIKVSLDGKYPEVKNLIFNDSREGSRESVSGLVKPTTRYVRV